MLISLNNFDPTTFLNIKTTALSAEELTKMRQDLNAKVGEYILLKLSDQLTEQQLGEISQIKDGKMMFNTLVKLIPDFEKRVLQELENFKNEYSQIVKGL